MNERAVRIRLVLGATIFAAVAIGAALIAGRMVIGAELRASVESIARGDLIPFVSDLQRHSDELPDQPGPGVLLGIRAPDGGWLVDTLPGDVREAIDDRDPADFEVRDADGDRSWVVVAQQVQTSFGRVSIWSAAEATAANRSLGNVDLLFILGGCGLIGLFAIAASIFVRSALRPVEAARRRERRFVSDAAHELRTPLAGLQAQLGVARRSLADPIAAAAELERAEASAERIGALASNLLELARLDEGSVTAGASAAELREAFLAAVDDIRLTPAAARVELDQTSPASVPEARADLDAVSFGRIVRNLLGNAVTAVHADGRVLAELRITPGRLLLVVQDDGPGIPPELLPRAVERFARGEGSGSGLGLALVDALVRSAGGDLSLRNTMPGLRVEAALPLH